MSNMEMIVVRPRVDLKKGAWWPSHKRLKTGIYPMNFDLILVVYDVGAAPEHSILCRSAQL